MTSGLLNAVVAEQLPGPGSVFLETRGGTSRRCDPATSSPRWSPSPPARTSPSPRSRRASRTRTTSSSSTAPPSSGVTPRSTPRPPPISGTDHRRNRMSHHHREGAAQRSRRPPRSSAPVTRSSRRTRSRSSSSGPPTPGCPGPTAAPRSSGFLGAMQEMQHAQRHRGRVRPPGRAGRHGRRPHAGRVPAARHRRLPHRGHRQHRGGPRRAAHAACRPPSRATSTCSGSSGLSDGSVRNGYEQIKVTFHIEGDADDATLRDIVEQSRRRSAVYDALTNPTPVMIDVVTQLTAARTSPTRDRPAHPGRSHPERNLE